MPNTDKNTPMPQCDKNSVSSSLYPLIDRLKKHSEWKYPNRKWTNNFYYECAFQWMNKIDELEIQVSRLENDMRLAGVI